MIPSKSNQISQTGTLPGKTTLMTIDAVHMPHIMDVLTRMYSDIFVAILREYSANAWDSHVMAGKEDIPIDIRTPNKFRPYLEIEDYGLGMSVDFVETEFSKYGASTKRKDNDSIGSFGIGGKSALAYTDSFTLTTVRDGVQGIFLVSRNEEGAAVITTVSVEDTTRGNGTKISIPVEHSEDFEDKVKWFFKFWKPGTVLVNGKQPDPIKAEKLTDDVYFVPNGGNSYVVMGNIPYRVANPANYLPSTWSQFSFIIHVPIGSVSITPSREALEYGDTATVEQLKKVGKAFADHMLDKIKKEILEQPNHFKAWERWNHWTQTVRSEELLSLKYKGDKFVTRIETSGGYLWNRSGYSRNGMTWLSNYGRSIDIASLKCVVVQSKTDEVVWTEAPSSYWRQKTKWYFQSLSKLPTHIYFLNEVPKSPWIQGMEVHLWEDVKKASDPNRIYNPTVRKPSGMVSVLSSTGYWQDVKIADLPKNNLVLITPFDARNMLLEGRLCSAMKTLNIDATIIKLAENRWAKFKRDHKDAENFKPWLESQVRLATASIPEDSWELRGLGANSKNLLSSMDADLVDDPKVKKFISLIKDRTKASQRDADFATARTLWSSWKGPGIPFEEKESEDWFRQRYPLAKHIGYYGLMESKESMDDFYEYLNYKYKRGTK